MTSFKKRREGENAKQDVQSVSSEVSLNSIVPCTLDHTCGSDHACNATDYDCGSAVTCSGDYSE
jgi:hypothetical protein